MLGLKVELKRLQNAMKRNYHSVENVIKRVIPRTVSKSAKIPSTIFTIYVIR